jgi:hypothetical protein
MIRKTYLLLSLCLFLGLTKLMAQQGPFQQYNFIQRSEAYQSLKGQGVQTIDDLSQPTPIPISLPFSYQFAGQQINQLNILQDGELHLIGPGSASDEVLAFSPFATDLTEKNGDGSGINSLVAYQLSGSLGNRILKIEFQRMGFAKGSVTDEISFQVWMYEARPVIEFRYGGSVLADTAAVFDFNQGGYPPTVGMAHIDWTTEQAEGIFLSGEGTQPSLVAQSGDYIPVYLSSPPAPDAVYRFCPGPFCNPNTAIVDHLPGVDLHLFPNPSRGKTRLELSLQQAESLQGAIFNLQGQRVQHLPTRHLPAGKHQLELDLSTLPNGMYLLRASLGQHALFERIQVAR